MIRPSVWDGMGREVPLICIRDQARGVRHFNTSGKSGGGNLRSAPSEIFLREGLDKGINSDLLDQQLS